MREVFINSVSFLRKNPCFVVVLLVYIYIFGFLLTYHHSWVHPEAYGLKKHIVECGMGKDISSYKHIFNYEVFEHGPRLTRPLSSFFEIVDTRFRIWLWRRISPHPSLSLTWLFSFGFSPLFLFLFLKNIRIKTNIGLAAVSLYLMSPGTLSYSVMLFRPAKAMTNFSILLCSYLASCLFKKIYANNQSIKGDKDPLMVPYLVLILIMFFSFFWDETALLVFPAVLFFFPSLLKDKRRALLFVSLPLLTALFYFLIIPQLTKLAGFSRPDFLTYNLLDIDAGFWARFSKYFFLNSSLLFLDSLGLAPLSLQAPWYAKVLMTLNVVGLISLMAILGRKIFWALIQGKADRENVREIVLWAGWLFFLCLFHSSLMAVSNYIWGLYWYGSYWPVFFVIFIAILFTRIRVYRGFILTCLIIVLINQGIVFQETNRVYKKYHYYLYAPVFISYLFLGDLKRFDPATASSFSGEQLKGYIRDFWNGHRKNSNDGQGFLLPGELSWVSFEVAGGKCSSEKSMTGILDLDVYYCQVSEK